MASSGIDGILADVLAQRGADQVGREEIGRGQQPVAAAADAFQRQTGGFGFLQNLRNAGARHPHRLGEVFTGVESAVA